MYIEKRQKNCVHNELNCLKRQSRRYNIIYHRHEILFFLTSVCIFKIFESLLLVLYIKSKQFDYFLKLVLRNWNSHWFFFF